MVDNHLEITKNWGPSDNVVISVSLNNNLGIYYALDLGCGSLRNSRYLCQQGYHVNAIDLDSEVKKYAQDLSPSYFNLKIANYLKTNLAKNKYDLVVAQNTLSFNSKFEVKLVIKKIHQALRTGGYLAINLFGLKDYHYGSSNMSFYTKNETTKLLSVFKIKSIIESTGELEKNNKKVLWHTFEIVAQK